MLYPEVQRTAQREIDTVLGRGELATWEDTEKLPYVRGLLSEVYRWNPVGPLGMLLEKLSSFGPSLRDTLLLALPRRVTNEDEYAGYRIPAGATIFGNSWYVLRASLKMVFETISQGRVA